MPHLLQRLIAAAGLVVLSPLLLLISIAILITEGRPVLYKPTRIGRDREAFTQHKFRSMVNNADQLLGEFGTDAPEGRVTRVGKLLRRSSLDELPQLVNVVNGTMALVGPRPLLPEVADRVPQDHVRFNVLPGLTGLAQVSGRNSLPWSERLALDAVYVAERSIMNDVRLLASTVRVVTTADGIALDRNTESVLDI